MPCICKYHAVFDVYDKTLLMIRWFDFSNPASPPPNLDRIENDFEGWRYKKAYLFLAKVICMIPLKDFDLPVSV